MPDDLRTADYTDFSPGWGKVYELLAPGRKNDPYEADGSELFADFVVCPTKPFHEGASQPATVKSVAHAHLSKHPQ
jgi:hypothetical protein